MNIWLLLLPPVPQSIQSFFYRCVTYKFQTFSKSVYNWLPKKKQLKIKLKSSSLKNSSWYSFLWKYYQSGPPHHQKSSLSLIKKGLIPVPKTQWVRLRLFWCQLLDKHRRVLQFLVCSIQTTVPDNFGCSPSPVGGSNLAELCNLEISREHFYEPH